MTKTVLYGTILATVFALSMIMLPVYAGGHVMVDEAKMVKHVKKGTIDLTIKVTAKIPKDESSSFGWALLGWERVLVEVTHIDPPLGDDSDFETKKGGFHNHVLSVVPADADDCASELKVEGPVTDPNFKDKVGKEKIKIKKVPLSVLGPRLMPLDENPILVAGFTLTPGEGDSICVNVISFVAPEIKTKK